MQVRLVARAFYKRLRRIPVLAVLPLLAAVVIANPVGMFQGSISGASAVDGAEYQAQVSLSNVSGQLDSITKHVMQTTLMPNYFPATFYTTAGGDVRGGTTSQVVSTSGTGATGTTTTGGTTTTSTTGTTGLTQATVTGTDYYLQVTNPTESPGSNPNWVATANVVVNSGGSTQPGLTVFKIREIGSNPGNVTFPSGYTNGTTWGSNLVNLAAVGTISSGAMTVVETGVPWSELWDSANGGQSWYLANNGRTLSTKVTQVLQNFTVSKLPAYDAAIDTRVTYGVPNDAGVIPGADPNAGPGYVNYTPWIWQGGLFVGNAPWIDDDGSGRARVQFWPQGVTSAMVPNCYSTFVAFYLGSPSPYNVNMTVGLYTPSTTDSDLSYTESTVSWPYRWTSLDTGGGGTFLASVAFTSASTLNTYYNFHLGVNQPQSALTYEAFVNTQEAAFLANNTQGWQYFASRWYGSSVVNPVYPYTDCAPRLWVVTLNGSPTNWLTNNSVFGAQ